MAANTELELAPRRVAASPSRRWLALGVLASCFYGLWGFFASLSTFQSPIVANAVVYLVALAFGLSAGWGRLRGRRALPLLVGVAGGSINLLVLVSLTESLLILVYPFVSFGSVVFIALHLARFRPPLTSQQRLLLVMGTTIAISGLVACGIGISGGLGTIVATFAPDVTAVAIGLTISVLSGVWAFLVNVMIVERGHDPRGSLFWVAAGAAALSIVGLLALEPRALGGVEVGPSWFFPALAGIFIASGQLCTHYAFRGVNAGSRVEEIIVGVLSNAEIVPIIALSFFVLGESSPEGFFGALLVFVGIVLLNWARTS